MKKLPTDIKQKWVAALRSGKYKQGIHCLRSASDEYCCLGVLCDLSDVAWVECALFYTLPSGIATMPNVGDIDKRVFDVLEQSVYENNRILSAGHHLTNMNDQERLSFEQIADWIDVNLQYLSIN